MQPLAAEKPCLGNSWLLVVVDCMNITILLVDQIMYMNYVVQQSTTTIMYYKKIL